MITRFVITMTMAMTMADENDNYDDDNDLMALMAIWVLVRWI